MYSAQCNQEREYLQLPQERTHNKDAKCPTKTDQQICAWVGWEVEVVLWVVQWDRKTGNDPN